MSRVHSWHSEAERQTGRGSRSGRVAGRSGHGRSSRRRSADARHWSPGRCAPVARGCSGGGGRHPAQGTGAAAAATAPYREAAATAPSGCGPEARSAARTSHQPPRPLRPSNAPRRPHPPSH
eukprot:29319-Prymnesium_polylepis.1